MTYEQFIARLKTAGFKDPTQRRRLMRNSWVKYRLQGVRIAGDQAFWAAVLADVESPTFPAISYGIIRTDADRRAVRAMYQQLQSAVA